MEKGILGPHEGKELELMLRGEKQVALFNQELGIPDAFLPYLELGMLHSKTNGGATSCKHCEWFRSKSGT